MMGGVSPEICWAIKKHWNNKFYYTVVSCWFVLLILYYDARIHEHQICFGVLLNFCVRPFHGWREIHLTPLSLGTGPLSWGWKSVQSSRHHLQGFSAKQTVQPCSARQSLSLQRCLPASGLRLGNSVVAFHMRGESCLYLLVIYERKHEFLVWSASEDNSLNPLRTGNMWSESFGSIYENWCGNLILFYGW